MKTLFYEKREPRYASDTEWYARRPWWEATITGLAILSMLVVVAGVIFGFVQLGHYMNKRACREEATIMERDWRWGAFHGCMVEHDGQMIPLNNFRVNDGETE